ncbi:hypothetical protein GCM10020255_048870 [Rhodococcus baikonurensis]
MLGFDDDDGSTGVELAHQSIRDLTGQAFLNLRTLGVQIDDTRELRQTGDLARLSGDVANVGDAVEGHQVVLARREHRNVSHEHQFLVALVESCVQRVVGLGVQTREDLLVRARNPGGVSSRPGRSGSSPTAINNSRTAASARA